MSFPRARPFPALLPPPLPMFKPGQQQGMNNQFQVPRMEIDADNESPSSDNRNQYWNREEESSEWQPGPPRMQRYFQEERKRIFGNASQPEQFDDSSDASWPTSLGDGHSGNSQYRPNKFQKKNTFESGFKSGNRFVGSAGSNQQYGYQQDDSQQHGYQQADNQQYGRQQDDNQQYGRQQDDNQQFANQQLGNPHFGNWQFGNRQFGNQQLGNEQFGNSQQFGNRQFGNRQFGNQQFGKRPFANRPFVKKSGPSKPPGNSPAMAAMKFCEICKIPLGGAEQAVAHYTGKAHTKNVVKSTISGGKTGSAKSLQCKICNIIFNSFDQAQQHFESYRHLKHAIGEDPLMKTKQDGTEASDSSQISAGWKSNFPVARAIANYKKKLAESVSTGDANGIKVSSLQGLCCETCNVSFTSESKAREHYMDALHLQRVSETPATTSAALLGTPQDKNRIKKKNPNAIPHLTFTCHLCSVTAPSQSQIDMHLGGVKHHAKMKLAQQGLQKSVFPKSVAQSDTPKSVAQPTVSIKCDLCNIIMRSAAQCKEHVSGEQHKANLNLLAAKAAEAVSSAINETIVETDLIDDVSNRSATESVAQPTTPLKCDVCNITVTSAIQYEAHISGINHKTNLELLGADKTADNLGSSVCQLVSPKDQFFNPSFE